MLQELFDLSPAEMPKIGGAIFAYMFHRIDQKKLIEVIRRIDPSKEEKVLETVRTSGYVMLHCKAYGWAYYKSRFDGSEPDAMSYLVMRDDPKFMRRYREDPEFVNGIKKDAEFLRRLNLDHIDMKYDAFSMKDYKALIEGAVASASVDTYIGKYISKRMTFLIKSYGAKRTELENDMKGGALRAIYMKYPEFESVLHLQNTAKTAIHNTGESLVTYYTSPSRQRLMVNEAGGFEARNVNTESLIDLEAPKAYLEDARDHLEVLVRLGDKLKPEVQRFLLCLAGQYDAEFSEYLQVDNTEAVEEMAYSRYVGRARKFFRFNEKQVNNLFSKLRTHLQTGALQLT